MNVRTRVSNGVQVLDLAGRLTMGAGNVGLRDAIKTLTEAGQSKIVLNLEQVDYVDSSGLGEMISVKKQALRDGGDVRLLSPKKKVREVLVMSRLVEVFRIFEEESDAVDSF